MGRQYTARLEQSGRELMWKGSKKVLNLVDDNAPRCNGNLKLFDPINPGKVLAIRKNRTDPHILGSIMILEDLGDNRPLQEVILWSCLAIVMAERVAFRGWVGGAGKGGGDIR